MGLHAVHIGLQAVHIGLQPRERRADVRPERLELRHDEVERWVERGTVRDEGGHVALQVGHLVEERVEVRQQQRQIAGDLAQVRAEHLHPVEHAGEQRREALEVPADHTGRSHRQIRHFGPALPPHRPDEPWGVQGHPQTPLSTGRVTAPGAWRPDTCPFAAPGHGGPETAHGHAAVRREQL